MKIRKDLTEDEFKFINEEITKTANKFGMYLREDGITYAKTPPYKRFSDIHSGVSFYFKMEKYKDYFTSLTYSNYLEGEIDV